MNPRFQIFVSSTYTDLIAERKAVIDALNKAGHIAVGMEQFLASPDEQMDYIRPIIDESDYYVLILKAKYGSVGSSGISFTQMEFEYAEQEKKPILAFLYKDLQSLTISDTDDDPGKAAKLKSFRDLLVSRRIVSHWHDKEDLVSLIKDAVNLVIRSKPGVGWVRGDQAVSVRYLKEMAELQQANGDLRGELERLKSAANLQSEGYEQGDDKLNIKYFFDKKLSKDNRAVVERTGPFDYTTTWDRMFASLSDLIIMEESEGAIKRFLCSRIQRNAHVKLTGSIYLPENAFLQLRYQFQALGLVEAIARRAEDPGDPGSDYGYICWRMTEAGRRHISKAMAKRRDEKSLESKEIIPS